MRAPVVVLDHNMRPVADLGEVTALGYTQHLRELWTASFTIRADDPKRIYCKPYAFVRIYDADREVGLFRIASERAQTTGRGHTVTYQCEHALATLCDDMILGHHNVYPPSTDLHDALAYILSHQTTQRWVLHRLDFVKTWWHFWEDRTLLEALFDALAVVNEDWMFSFDTTSTPWRLSVIAPPVGVKAYLDAGRNLDSVDRDSDPRDIVTRLYAYGYGVGADQLTIASVNPTGEEYIDADTIGEYGVIVRRWEDQRYTSAQDLYDAAVARLERLKRPATTYTIGAIDLARITGYGTDKLRLGDQIRIVDASLGIDHVERIATISYRDILGAPGEVSVVIGDRREFPDYGDIIYADDLDGVKAPGAFGRVLSTQIEAGKIKLSAVPGGSLGPFPAPPVIAGLYLGATHLGYHDGNQWVTYMDAAGRLRCVGTGGGLEFDPTAEPAPLTINGVINVTGGKGSIGVVNPSFEDGDVGWPVKGGSWQIVEDAGAYAGEWCAKAIVTGGATAVIQNGYEFHVSPTRSYYVAARVKTAAGNTGNVGVRIAWLDTDGNVISYTEALAAAPKTSWTLVEASGAAPSGAITARVEGVYSGFTGTVYLDAVDARLMADTSTIENLSITGAKIVDATITSGKIASMTFDKLTAGTNTSSLVIGSGGEIKSANYSAGSAGFRIQGNGNAEFNNVTVRGAVYTQSGSSIGGQYISGTLTGCVFQGASSYPYAKVSGNSVWAYQSSGYYSCLQPTGLVITGSTDTVGLSQTGLIWSYGSPTIQSGSYLTIMCGPGYGININSGTGGYIRLVGGDIQAGSSGTQNLGTSSLYWNEVNYKSLVDRGCLGWFDGGVRLRDGRMVSDIAALREIRPHPTLRTPYGTERLDYATLPEAVYRPAPVAFEDTREGDRLWKRGEKMGEDGACLDALVSIMLGAIKELDARLSRIEGIDAGGEDR